MELAQPSTFTMEHTDFDYLEQKMLIRELFNQFVSDKDSHRQAMDLLGKFKGQTQQVSASLCEQLRIILEP